ncbi:hypothetical protein Pmani_015400 [Petrolisthes manimaculis]|uniref:Uncharacterized protein n=1 Tax=Petrolisthes manimaculis TaxID=1843537 RepID=A0AAE1PS95_9EUCA|nr:hypothetical protein Pmani_015400 [Petrolisthes manimaculis]
MSTVLVNVRYEPFTLPGNDMEAGLLVSLVLFLLQPSQHTEVVIIHDYTLPGVKELAESFSERWAATTLLTATPAPDLSQLLVALTSFHTNDLRYMVLLCSANTTWTIFDMVSRHNLESRRVRWLVVANEPNVADTLPHWLREESMVGLAARVRSDLYNIYSSYVDHKNQVRFHKVGSWRGQSTGSLSRPLFPDIVNLYRNFKGRQLVTAVVDYWPFFEVKTLDNGTAVAGKGIDVNTINTLGYYLNFTYRVRVPDDKQWGTVQEDGTVTGMVGEVAARRANLAINAITITASRETVVDFSSPYFFATTSIVSRAPAEKNRSLAVFYPFSSLNHHHPGKPVARVFLATQTVIFLLVRLLCHLIWKYSVVAVYSGTLTSYLIKPSFDKPVDSLEDLLAARERGVVAVVTRGTSTERMFKVTEKNTARIGSRVGLEIYSIMYLVEGYHLAINTFYPQSYGVACPPNAPYVATLSLMLDRMVQAGLVDKWYRDEVTLLKQRSGQRRKSGQNGASRVEQGRVAVKPLALDHVQVK